MGAITGIHPGDILANSAEPWQAELGLLARHDLYFETQLADRPALARAAHALRHQVYCLERQYDKADELSAGPEVDPFDSQAIQGLLFHRPTDTAIGTVRMILPGNCAQTRLPVAQLLRHNNIDLAKFVPVDNTVEVSRFAISKDFRRRWTDDHALAETRSLSRQETARQANLACLSLIQFLLRQSIEHEVFYWTAVMEGTVLRMLARMGIHFTSIGSVVFHHGQPCYCYLPTMLEEMRAEHRDYWDVVTNGGELNQRLTQLTEAPLVAMKIPA